jgi:hypothetical protein
VKVRQEGGSFSGGGDLPAVPICPTLSISPECYALRTRRTRKELLREEINICNRERIENK